jgi:DedD protein
VSLAVIFIPVILEGPDNEWAPLTHSIPEPPQLDYKARMNMPQPVEVPVPAPVKPAREAVPEPVEDPAEQASRKPDVPTPETESAVRETTSAEALSGWYVQVGSFSRELNASGLSKRLKLSGYEAVLQKTGTDTGLVYRVMVGPSKSREVAEKLRDRLAKERQLEEGIVINNPG